MKNIKKILTGTIVSALSITAIGCGANTHLTKKIENTTEVLTNAYTYNNSPEKIGKIIETSNVSTYSNANKKTKKKDAVISTANNFSFLNNNISELEIENSISKPTDATSFNIFVLSDTPFITMTSDDNNSSYLFNIKFTSNPYIFQNSEKVSKLNELSLKKSILMLYANEIYNENVILSNEDKLSINNHLNTLNNKSNANLSNTTNNESLMIKNNSQTTHTSSYSNKNSTYNDIDSKIQAIDSIINIIENNLVNSSCYYNSKLTDTINNISTCTTEILQNEIITDNSTNKEIAKIISNSLKMCQNSQKIQDFSENQLTNSQSKILDNSNNFTNQKDTNIKDIIKLNNTDNSNNPTKNTNQNSLNNTNFNKEKNNLIKNETLNNNNINQEFNYNDMLNNKKKTNQNLNYIENSQSVNHLTQPSNNINNNQNNGYEIETNHINNNSKNNINKTAKNNRRNITNNQNRNLENNKANTSLNHSNSNNNFTTQVESNKRYNNNTNPNSSLNSTIKDDISNNSMNNNVLRFNNNFENKEPNYIASAYAPAENKAIRVPYKSADNMKI